jgi:adenylylsulfate kinase
VILDEADGQQVVGTVIWLTGLPSSGKTTVGSALVAALRLDGLRVQLLDGDEVRAQLSPGLGYSREDRIENVRRIGYVAGLLASHGVSVVAPVISPYRESRDALRASLLADYNADFVEVHIATPLDVCVARDVKGLYARQAAGEIAHLTGVDDPYEVPLNPDVRVDTSTLSLEESVAMIRAAVYQ